MPIKLKSLILLFSILSSFASPHGFEAQIDQIQQDFGVAIVNGREYTVREVREIQAIRSNPTFSETGLKTLSDFIQTVRDCPKWTAAAKAAKDKGVTLTPEQSEVMNSALDRYLDRTIYDEEIYSKRRQPTLEIVQQIYNEEAESRFAVPERLIIRTFEFSSKASADAFVSDYFETNEINESMASKALTHIKQLDQIEQKEILELHDGEMTSPIKVDDQWTVMLRRMKIPASKTPLEAVYQDVVDLHLQMQDQENMRNFYGLLIDQLDGIELKVGEEPSIQINEVILSGDELERLVNSDQKLSEMSLDQFQNLLVSQQPIQKMLLKEFIDQKNYHERRDVLFLKQIYEETQLVRNDLDTQAKQNGEEIAEQDYLDQFEQEIEFTPLLDQKMFAH